MRQPQEFTAEQIAAMSAEEYAHNREAIMAQLHRDGAVLLRRRRDQQLTADNRR